MKGASSPRVGGDRDALGAPRGARREARGGQELVPAPVSVVRRHVEPAGGHPVEVDQVLVVVDHLGRDAIGHALQAVVAAERLEGVAGVDVAEVDAALVEKCVDRAGQLVLGVPPQVAPRQQEHVGQGLALVDRPAQPVVGAPVLDGHLGAVVDRVEVVGHPGVGRDLLGGAVDAEGQVHRLARGVRGLRARLRGRAGAGVVTGARGQHRGERQDDQAATERARHRRPHRCPPLPRPVVPPGG